MQSSAMKHQFMPVIFIVFLMGIIAWLATGWQETPAVQLSYDPEHLDTTPWSEEHLITPVATHQSIVPASTLQAM